MSTINVLIAVDGIQLSSQVDDQKLSPGTQASPTNLGAYSTSDVFIAMIAPNSVSSNGQGTSELIINANSNDTVTWSITTFDNGADFSAYLYDSYFNPSAAMNPGVFDSSQTNTYLGQGNPPVNAPQKFVNQVNSFSAVVAEVGQYVQYTLSFVLVNNSNGAIVGYFYWDPFIKVS